MGRPGTVIGNLLCLASGSLYLYWKPFQWSVQKLEDSSCRYLNLLSFSTMEGCPKGSPSFAFAEEVASELHLPL